MKAPSDNRDGSIRAPSNGLPETVPTDGGTVVRSRLFIKYVVLFVAVVSLVLIANAVFDALGVRIRDLPITRDSLIAAMERS